MRGLIWKKGDEEWEEREESEEKRGKSWELRKERGKRVMGWGFKEVREGGNGRGEGEEDKGRQRKEWGVDRYMFHV